MGRLSLVLLSAVFGSACAQMTTKPQTTTAEAVVAAPAPTRAQALLKVEKGSKIKGLVSFVEENGTMTITTDVQGLKKGPHGFHIHETGDCSTADFSSAGGHFNPEKTEHGSHDSKTRHLGDLGNLVANKSKKANTTLKVEGLTLKAGSNSILGKSVVIHDGPDDLTSQPAGNSGKRIACGVIEGL